MSIAPGEDKAWEILSGLDPDQVCRNAQVTFDKASGMYTLRSCGKDFLISPKEGKITSEAPDSALFLNRLAYFFRLSVPWYLVSAKDIALSGKLVAPVNLTGGQLFFRGSHVLPLDKVAEKYRNDREGFLKKGAHFDGIQAGYGDASFTLFPVPRVPVTVILWLADEEFPPRVDILFDSTCELQLPLDIIWSIAMMSLLVLL
ncbi:MAG: DUF3786 domain-containing protein [Nitrospirota bacterium]